MEAFTTLIKKKVSQQLSGDLNHDMDEMEEDWDGEYSDPRSSDHESGDLGYDDLQNDDEHSVPHDQVRSLTPGRINQDSLNTPIEEEEDEDSETETGPVLRLPQHKPTVSTDSISDNDLNKTLLRITVEIDEGKHGEIVVRAKDNSDDLAEKFCIKHQIDLVYKSFIVRQIEENMAQLEALKRSWLTDESPSIETPYSAELDVSPIPSGSGKGRYKPDLRDPNHTFSPQINTNCERLMGSKANVSVYDRLYNPYYKESQSALSQVDESLETIKEAPSKSVDRSAGKELYKRGLRYKQKSMHNIEKLKAEKVEEEEKELNFRPMINSKSMYLKSRPKQCIENLLLSRDSLRKERLNIQRGLNLVQQDRHIQSAPKISTRSKKLSSKQSTQIGNIHQRLYTQASENQSRQKQYQKKIQKEECPFQPVVKEDPRRSTDRGSLIERLAGSRASIEEKLEKERDRLYNTIHDPETGQELFIPKILDNKKALEQSSRNPSNKSISDYLYEAPKSLVPKKKPESPPKKSIPARSQKLYDKLKTKRLQEIFNKISSEGKLDCKYPRLAQLEYEVAQVLEPYMEYLSQVIPDKI